MRIGMLARATGTATTALRFYEERGLLPPAPRTPAGYRDYPEDTPDRIDFIRRAQSAGLTLAQIRQILDLRDHGHLPCIHVRALLDQRLADLDTQIEQLQTLRATIKRLRHRAVGHDPADCPPGRICQDL